MSMIVFEDRVSVPDWVAHDLDSFRRWVKSGAAPEHGHFAFLDGEAWVDMSMEEAFRHNRLIARIVFALEGLVTASQGYLFWERFYYTNHEARLSTEPDGLFVSADSTRTGLAELAQEDDGRTLEIQGTVDMTLEVVSKTSVRKDTVTLRKLYHRAGVREYWLIDPRTSPARFEILRRTAKSYVSTKAVDGWLRSEVFDRSFRLEESTDPQGNPLYTLAVQ